MSAEPYKPPLLPLDEAIERGQHFIDHGFEVGTYGYRVLATLISACRPEATERPAAEARHLHSESAFLLMFADQDRGFCVYHDEAEAIAAFDVAKQRWTVTLYKLIGRSGCMPHLPTINPPALQVAAPTDAESSIIPPIHRAQIERILEFQKNDKRTEEQKIEDGVSFIMGPGGDEGTRIVQQVAAPTVAWIWYSEARGQHMASVTKPPDDCNPQPLRLMNAEPCIPSEPTHEMIVAGNEAASRGFTVRNMYMAMVAAAPCEEAKVAAPTVSRYRGREHLWESALAWLFDNAEFSGMPTELWFLARDVATRLRVPQLLGMEWKCPTGQTCTKSRGCLVDCQRQLSAAIEAAPTVSAEELRSSLLAMLRHPSKGDTVSLEAARTIEQLAATLATAERERDYWIEVREAEVAKLKAALARAETAEQKRDKAVAVVRELVSAWDFFQRGPSTITGGGIEYRCLGAAFVAARSLVHPQEQK